MTRILEYAVAARAPGVGTDGVAWARDAPVQPAIASAATAAGTARRVILMAAPSGVDGVLPVHSGTHDLDKLALTGQLSVNRGGLICSHAALRVPLPRLRRHVRAEPADGAGRRPRHLPDRPRRHGQAAVHGRRH